MPARRRIYLMRHADVSYFDRDGGFLIPGDVPLTPQGRDHARAAAAALRGVAFDRVVTSGLRRTVETAGLVLAGRPDAPPVEVWPQFRELRGGPAEAIPEERLEEAFLGVFKGIPPESARFLGGESIGSLFDRVVPALETLIGDATWRTVLMVLHGAVNRAIISHAVTGGRTFLGNLQQSPACLNVLDVGGEWVVWAVNANPYDLPQRHSTTTCMEGLLSRYRDGRPR